MRHRIVLFDIDNTLIQGGGVGRRAFERAVVEVTRSPLPRSRVAMAGRTDPSIVIDYLVAMGIEPAAPLVGRVLDRYVKNLAVELDTNRTSSVLPGVFETLDALARDPAVSVGLLTGNIARGASLKLRAHGLDGRFAFGSYGDDAAARADLLPIALSRWRKACGGKDVRMEDVHVVGDTVHDVAVARAHGARAVAVGTGVPYQDRAELLATQPDWFFEDLAKAGPWLSHLLAGA